MAGPESGTLPEEQVRAMFDRIARVYDLMNSVMTVGLHHRWRERAAELAAIGAGDRALDVATGTGDLAIALKRRAGAEGEIVGSDFSEQMLELARGKAPDVEFEHGNALDLPYEDGSFDAATVGFGARNFSDLARGLSELARVVRPRGRRSRGSSASGSTASCRSSGGWPAIPRPTPTCRARSAASRTRAASARP
jgi:demethylmenaquinone methyltransferase/2-methoxy-6-polyprenyl-1,4-benzoquinol methylase